MRLQFGTTTVTTAGTRVQISNTANRVKKIQFQTRAANVGYIYVGLSDVSATVNGWELTGEVAKGALNLDFSEGSVLLSVFYVDSSVDGEIVDWVAILG